MYHIEATSVYACIVCVWYVCKHTNVIFEQETLHHNRS